MRMHRIGLALLALFPLMTTPVPATAQERGWALGQTRARYDRGYRDGFRDGENDARRGRRYDYDNDRRLGRSGDEFQRGYVDGYRAGYEQFRGGRNSRYGNGGYASRDWGRGPRGGYQDPAFARGYSEGFERGLDDGRDRDRYDPVRHRDYRDADDGYFRDYGPKQTWENNYRAGFRQGYEEGYRDANRRR
jgi:hypothetical protein